MAATLMLGAGSLSACSDDETSDPGLIVGSWYFVMDTDMQIFSFGADGSFYEQYIYDYNFEDRYEDEKSYGTYTYDGKYLTVHQYESLTVEATVTNSTLTMSYEGATVVFTRM